MAKGVFTLLNGDVLLNEASRTLTASTEKLEVKGFEKRLVRIETMAKMSIGQFGSACYLLEDKGWRDS